MGDGLVTPLYLIVILLPLVTWLWTTRRSDSPELALWPEWTPRRVAVAAVLGAAALSAAIVRLLVPYRVESCSGTFADAMNASIGYALRYFEAVVILSLPMVVVAVLRRRTSWARGALLLLLTSFVACFQAADSYQCAESDASGARRDLGAPSIVRLVAHAPAKLGTSVPGTSRTLPYE